MSVVEWRSGEGVEESSGTGLPSALNVRFFGFETRCALKKKLQSGVDGVKTFTGDVLGEMKKATWPNRRELLESTMVVIVSLVLMSLFVGFCDRVLVMILQLLIPTGCI